MKCQNKEIIDPRASCNDLETIEASEALEIVADLREREKLLNEEMDLFISLPYT